MIIDFHTHLYQGLEARMKKSNVDKAVVLMPLKRGLYTAKGRIIHNTNAEILSGNEEVIEASSISDALVPFAWLNHRISDAAKRLRDYVQRGCKGLKLHPVIDHFSLLDRELDPIIDAAANLGIPIMIHTGWGRNGSVEDVGILAERYTDAKFVIAHMKEEWGVNKRLSHIEVASRYENVWLECSYVEHPRRITQAVEKLGSNRILFGSDWPFGSGDIGWDMTKVTSASITEEDKLKILGKNALQLLQ